MPKKSRQSTSTKTTSKVDPTKPAPLDAGDLSDAIEFAHSNLVDIVSGLIVTCHVMAQVNEAQHAVAAEDYQDTFRGMKVVLETVREHATLIRGNAELLQDLAGGNGGGAK